jgi:hypothetical protein
MKMLQKLMHTKKNLSLASKKENLFRKITTVEENAWILDNRYCRQSFWLLIESMNKEHVNFFLKSPPLLFLKTSGTLASSVHQHKSHHLILIYPDTYKFLSGLAFEKGIAILAHELGHLFFEHAKKKLTPLQAQVQADEFACTLGFGEELQEVLLEHEDLIECRVRVSYITSLLISGGLKLEKKLVA